MLFLQQSLQIYKQGIVKNDNPPQINHLLTTNLAGASLGKAADMLYAKQISPPTGKEKWTRAAADHLLYNSKYIVIVDFESFASVQFEKTNRCNVDYDKAGTPRKETRYVSPETPQM